MVFGRGACGGADAGSDRSWFGGTHEHAVHTGGNWQWRATSDQITVKLAKRLYNYMEMYGRLWVDEDADRKEQ